MLWSKRLGLNQPKTKKKVIEVGVWGPLASFMLGRNWGAVTIPLPFVCFILYWLESESETVWWPGLRVHEYQHVFQDEKNLCFVVTAIKYMYAHIVDGGYKKNRYEIEADLEADKAEDADWIGYEWAL